MAQSLSYNSKPDHSRPLFRPYIVAHSSCYSGTISHSAPECPRCSTSGRTLVNSTGTVRSKSESGIRMVKWSIATSRWVPMCTTSRMPSSSHRPLSTCRLRKLRFRPITTSTSTLPPTTGLTSGNVKFVSSSFVNSIGSGVSQVPGSCRLASVYHNSGLYFYLSLSVMCLSVKVGAINITLFDLFSLWYLGTWRLISI